MQVQSGGAALYALKQAMTQPENTLRVLPNSQSMASNPQQQVQTKTEPAPIPASDSSEKGSMINIMA